VSFASVCLCVRLAHAMLVVKGPACSMFAEVPANPAHGARQRWAKCIVNAATSRAIVGRLASEPTSRRTPKTANAGSRPPASGENDLDLVGTASASCCTSPA
jgi:hypothetical protein